MVTFIIFFMAGGFYVLRNPCLSPRSQKFSLTFSFRSLVVFISACKLVINFELIFLHDCEVRVNIVFHMNIQFFQIICWKDYLFSHWIILTLWKKFNWLCKCGSTSGFSILFPYLYIYPYTNATLSWLL